MIRNTHSRRGAGVSRRQVIGGAVGLGLAAGLRAADAASAPIKIGASLTMTGQYSAPAIYELQGYKLAITQINKAGGILGRPVSLITYDDQGNPSTSVQLYQKLLTDDRVDLLVSPYETDLTSAVAPIVNRAKIVMQCLAANTTAFKGQFPYLLQAMTQTQRYMTPAIDLAVARGYKTLALLVQNTQFPKSLGAGVKSAATAKGLDIVFEASYDPSTTDFSALVLKAGAKRPDIIIGATYLADSEGIMRAAKEQNVNAKMFAFSIGPVEPEFGTGLGAAAEDVFGTTLWFPTLKTPGNTAFVSDFTSTFGHAPDYHAALAYASLKVLAAAVDDVGALDQNKIRENLLHTPRETVAGRYQLDATGVQIGYQSYLLQWQKGVQQLVWPAASQTATPILPHPQW
jgi:branched-chain amino acid transport system substrate-binding protein